MALPEQTTRAPTPFGPYLLDAPIAEGGMARVYRARLRGALGFEKPLVVKQVRPELAREPRFVEMFAREAKALVRLVHPHIVPIYELGVVDGVYFIAMEHIEGATLEGLLAEGPLDPGAAAHLGIQVAEALHHAHDRHALVHRDVTPRNVMVDEGGHARLLDFGIATPAEGTDGEVFGTPGYLSPEQARGGEVGPPSDVFSLGCVLARAMMGAEPYAGDPGRERLLAGERPALEALPEALGDLVRAMLAAEASARPSAAEVARGLRSWLAGAHPEGVSAAVAERARRMKDRPAAVVTTGESTAAVGKVQTLATSPVLDRARPTEAVEATQPIEGRGPRSGRPPRGSEVEATGTATAKSEARGTATAKSEARGTATAKSEAKAKWAGAAVAVVGLVVAVAAWGLREPGGTEETRSVEPAAEAMAPPEPEPATMSAEPATEAEPVAVVEGEPTAMVAAAPRRGTLRITASPWAEVRLDGRSLGNTPLRSVSATEGTHRLRFDCPPLGASVEDSIEVAAGTEIAVFADLQQDPPRIVAR